MSSREAVLHNEEIMHNIVILLLLDYRLPYHTLLDHTRYVQAFGHTSKMMNKYATAVLVHRAQSIAQSLSTKQLMEDLQGSTDLHKAILNNEFLRRAQSLSTKQLMEDLQGSAGLHKVILNDEFLRRLNNGHFVDARDRTTITIPEGLIVLRQRTFAQCTLLRSIVFPKSLRSIGGLAFSDCVNLRSIDLHHTQIKKIGKGAFLNCNLLQEEVLLPTNPVNIHNEAFDARYVFRDRDIRVYDHST